MITPSARTSSRLIALTFCAAQLSCSDPPPADQGVLSAQGRFPVAVRDLDLVDGARPTPANGDFPGSPERALPTRVWYPSVKEGSLVPAPGHFPLLGYAHGFTADKGSGAPFATHLASHGYIVAAPDFPLSHGRAKGGSTLSDLASQPGDLLFVLRAITALDGEDAALGRAVDRSRQGILGLSMGGATVLLAAYHPTLRIDGISAAVAQAPLSCPFGPALYSRPFPTLIMSGDADELVRFSNGPARAFSLAPAPVTLLRLRGGNHMGFVGIDAPGLQNTDDVVCDLLRRLESRGSTEGIFDRLAEGAPAGVIDASACDRMVCPESIAQGMTAERQLELSKTATLAHFEAVLRGRDDARRLLERALPANNSDVEVSIK